MKIDFDQRREELKISLQLLLWIILWCCTMCRVVTVVILEPLNLFALIIAFWFQSDQYRESSNVDILNGWGNHVGLNNTRRRWLPSKLHDEMVWSLASTQYNRFDTKSRVSPLGHFTSNEAINSRCVPSMPARSILALLPQSLQYNHLEHGINDKLNDNCKKVRANNNSILYVFHKLTR